MADLHPFEGCAVVGTTIKITHTGDGLSAAMKIDPVEYRKGERLYVVLECDVVDATHPPVDAKDPGGDCIRQHIFRAGHAVIVDAELVKPLIDEQADRIARAREEAAGIERLPFDLDDDEAEVVDVDGLASLDDQLEDVSS